MAVFLPAGPSASRYDEMYTELKDSLDISQDGEIPLMEKELVFSIAVVTDAKNPEEMENSAAAHAGV